MVIPSFPIKSPATPELWHEYFWAYALCHFLFCDNRGHFCGCWGRHFRRRFHTSDRIGEVLILSVVLDQLS